MDNFNSFLESVKNYVEEIFIMHDMIDLFSADMVEDVYFECEALPHGNPYKVARIIADLCIARISNQLIII